VILGREELSKRGKDLKKKEMDIPEDKIKGAMQKGQFAK